MSLKKLFSVAVVFASLTPVVHAQASLETERVASVLFKHFETVTFTKVDFLVDSESEHHSRYIESENNMRLPFLSLLGGLLTLGPDVIPAFEENYGEVMNGAKDFVPPGGLGMALSRTCYVAIAKPGNHPDMESVFSKASVVIVAGRKVWTWDAPPYEASPKAVTHFYALQMENDLILTNDRADIEEVSAALSSTPSASPDIAEWSTIRNYPYWSYRTLNPKTATKAGLGSDVTSVMLYTELADQGKGEVIVKVTTTASNVSPQLFSNAQKTVKFRYERPGLWAATLPLAKGIPQDEPLDIVFAALGFGLYI